MYILSTDPIIFLNPLQVESIHYMEAKLVLNAAGKGKITAVIKMATGEEYILHEGMCDIDDAVKKLVFQIDLANGLTVASNDEPTTTEEPAPYALEDGDKLADD